MLWIGKLIGFLVDLFGRRKKTPGELEDEAETQVVDNTLDDDIADINSELLDDS